jgi:uncharacterized protein YecT (DUF1311 family)
MILRLALIVAAFLFVATARADDPPNAKDVTNVRACLRINSGPLRIQERCIESVYKRCIGPKADERPTSEVVACLRREQLVWDQMLNDAFRSLRDGLDDDQRVKLRDMQRAWIEARDRTCAFYYDFYQGTMATPMEATCDNREVARRAIFLMGFAAEMASWVKNNR